MTDYLTQKVPGTGGTIRHRPEDFQVDEIPLYEPCGEGEHLYLKIEKKGLSTFDVLRKLAKALRCNDQELGYAGLKDARAITRQTISIPSRKAQELERIKIPGVRVLSADLHKNKLRQGHLSGNHFRIRIHNPSQNALSRAYEVIKTLEEVGAPNKFGEQRYGVLGNSHLIGRAILRQDFPTAISEIIGDPKNIEHPEWREAALAFRHGDITSAVEKLPRHCQPESKLLKAIKYGTSPRDAIYVLPRKLLRLYLSAYQSSLFDRIVEMRLTKLHQIWLGDIAFKHANGACFLVTNPDQEQIRARNFEISATGPLYGFKSQLAEGCSGDVERSLLDREDLRLEEFRQRKGLSMQGERRPLRVPVKDPFCESDGKDLLISFTLPKGSFATTVLSEVMKTP